MKQKVKKVAVKKSSKTKPDAVQTATASACPGVPEQSKIVGGGPVAKKRGFIAQLFDWVLKPVKWLWKHKWWMLIIICAVLAALYFTVKKNEASAVKFATMPIARGDVRQVVTATGGIQPVSTIMVGSQVSGQIQKIYVDYNDVVKKGQVLLTIDPSVLQAQVDNAKASLVSAQARAAKARADYDRSTELYNNGYIARADLETDQTNSKTADQAVKQAQSQYDTAVTNLGYATITSPVNGTVISRQVENGQTVAASFQTPNLFEIAEDLTKMQIQTSVSEADIGMVKEGQAVTFTVDAYPNQTFKGVVQQIRLSPTTTQNVVVYTVIINVDNGDLKLMPGMTAFVTIVVAEKKDVWKAQNAAFLARNLKPLSNDPRVQSGEMTGKNTLLIQRAGADKTAAPTMILMPYQKGLASATDTEIVPTSDIQPQKGDQIVTGQLGVKTTAPIQMGGPMGGGGNRPGGMGGGRMGG
ncbi:MAG: efflux RND transporter periplasmic adaptor subunit [Proteobacteria bacterium]|nr:efflux RND transporter periplasmic adaptor subunit [Pseudomonadota bacterium]